MKIIKDYIEVLFLQVPVTEETLQVKEDLLNTAEDHYEGLIAEGVSEKEAIGIVISEFGSIDDILAALDLHKIEPEQDESFPNGRMLSLDEAQQHWKHVRGFATMMASALGVIIFGFACLPFVEYGYGGALTILTLLFVFFLWGSGFLVFMIQAFDYRKKVKQVKGLPISNEVFEAAITRIEDYRRSYLISIVLAFIAFSFSLPVLFIFSEWFSSFLGIFLFFLLFGVGSFLVLYVSIIQKEFKRFILSYQKKARNTRPKKELNENIYWVSIVLLYFVFSFISNGWLYSWLIFLIGFVVSERIKGKQTTLHSTEKKMI